MSKVLLPYIKSIDIANLADMICSIQPMSASAGQIFQMSARYNRPNWIKDAKAELLMCRDMEVCFDTKECICDQEAYKLTLGDEVRWYSIESYMKLRLQL